VSGSLPEGETSIVMCNYLSIGIDTKAALLWARLKMAAPWAFKLRLINKLWYIICGTPEAVLHSYRDLSSRCELTCDGETIAIPSSVEGLMVLNTPSYGGGSDLWDEARAAPLRARTDRFQSPTPARPLRMDDGLLEVVGVTDVVHLACSLGGLSNGVRLCQGSRITLSVPGGGVPLQIDGEPYNVVSPADAQYGGGFEPFHMELERDGQALMLARAPRSTPRRGNAVTAVETQLQQRLLSTPQRDALLWTLAGSEGPVCHVGVAKEAGTKPLPPLERTGEPV